VLDWVGLLIRTETLVVHYECRAIWTFLMKLNSEDSVYHVLCVNFCFTVQQKENSRFHEPNGLLGPFPLHSENNINVFRLLPCPVEKKKEKEKHKWDFRKEKLNPLNLEKKIFNKKYHHLKITFYSNFISLINSVTNVNFSSLQN